LKIRIDVGNRRGESRTLKDLGRAYADLGQYERALEYLEGSLKILKEVGARWREGHLLNILGRVYSSLGKKERAWKCYKEALGIYKEIGNRWHEGKTLHYIGKFYFEQNHYDVALASFLLAKSILEEVQHPDRDETQRLIDKLHAKIGDEQFTALLAKVELQAQEIVEQALREDRE
jgi:tetratricopeptide (TPR) repeat protein